MSARIIVHPKVVKDIVLTATLDQTLFQRGYDTTRMSIVKQGTHGQGELVRTLETHNDGSHTYARMDGMMFRHPASGGKEAA